MMRCKECKRRYKRKTGKGHQSEEEKSCSDKVNKLKGKGSGGKGVVKCKGGGGGAGKKITFKTKSGKTVSFTRRK